MEKTERKKDVRNKVEGWACTPCGGRGSYLGGVQVRAEAVDEWVSKMETRRVRRWIDGWADGRMDGWKGGLGGWEGRREDSDVQWAIGKRR